MKSKYKTTYKDFETFKLCCEEWRKQFGLVDWVVYYKVSDIEDSYAQTKWDTNDRVATIEFSSTWDDMREISAVEIDKLALHEILHLVMAPLSSEAEYRYSTEGSIHTAEHAIVRTLENVISGYEHDQI